MVEIEGRGIERYGRVMEEVNMLVGELVVEVRGKYRYMVRVEVWVEGMGYRVVEEDWGRGGSYWGGKWGKGIGK